MSVNSNAEVARVRSGEVRFKSCEIQEHLIRSTIVAETFRVRVWQPVRRSDNSEKFPVLYATDGDEFFDGLATLANELQLAGETPRFILVGIGYENVRAADLLRMRDLLTHAIRERYHELIAHLAHSPLISGVDDLTLITQTTDATDFLRFIREELMPFINGHYPVRDDDNNYFGYSAGGTFGLSTLFTRSETFRRYILGSPATSTKGENFAIQQGKAFLQSGQTMRTSVFVSVGELEEFQGPFELTTGYYALARFLKVSNIPGLSLTVRLFREETHATAWTLAFSHGLRALFGPASSLPFASAFRGD